MCSLLFWRLYYWQTIWIHKENTLSFYNIEREILISFALLICFCVHNRKERCSFHENHHQSHLYSKTSRKSFGVETMKSKIHFSDNVWIGQVMHRSSTSNSFISYYWVKKNFAFNILVLYSGQRKWIEKYELITCIKLKWKCIKKQESSENAWVHLGLYNMENGRLFESHLTKKVFPLHVQLVHCSVNTERMNGKCK